MQRRTAAVVKNVCTEIQGLYKNNNDAGKIKIKIKQNSGREQVLLPSLFDVFISHRGIDTRRNVAGILYEHLSSVGLRPFLDTKSMSPGDNLITKIDSAINSCRVGMPVFSPRYCESYYCLYELAQLMRSNKPILPIFCNVKPSQLRVPRNRASLAKRLHRFAWAVDQAKSTVGLSFDSTDGDWSKMLSNVSEAVMKLVQENEIRSTI